LLGADVAFNFSPTIGRVAGIGVQLHWSFILLMLFALVLSFYIFLVFLLLFVCVFLHELAHSLTAKRYGIGVKKIVLYPLGGGSIIDLDNVPPSLEFRISIAGPVSSFLLAFLFGMAVVLLPGGTVKVFVQLLFILNLLLAVFNILPWFPMDGGRVLRSYLQRRHSFLDSTRTAVKASNVLIVLFIVGTLVYVGLEPGYPFFYKELIVLWDVFIAVFLYGGAKAELQAAYLKTYTRGLTAVSAMTKNYIMTKGSTTLARLYGMVLDKHTHIVLFRNAGKYYVVSRLPYNSLGKMAGGMANQSISGFSAELPTLDAKASLYSALERMQEANTGVAGVLSHGMLVGILQRQHVESVIALHVSRAEGRTKNA
jgi:Zn-dependent protease